VFKNSVCVSDIYIKINPDYRRTPAIPQSTLPQMSVTHPIRETKYDNFFLIGGAIGAAIENPPRVKNA